MREPSIIESGSHLRISDKLMKDNELWLEGEITPQSVDLVISALHLIEKKCTNQDGIIDGNVRLLIAGPGGSISAALNLANYLKNTPLNVTTTAVNNSYSASAIVWLAGDRREILRYSRVMFHEVKHFVREDTSYSIEKINEIYNDLKRLNNNIYKIMSEAIGKDKKYIKNMIHGKELWFFSKEALEHGLATEIIDTL